MAETNLTFDVLARDRASATFNKIGRSTSNLERSMGRLSRAARVALGGLAVYEAGRAVRAIGSIGIAYQDSLNIFQSVSRATSMQMDQVAQKAKALGANLKLPTTSAADAAAAMTELAKGGLGVNQSMKAALGTLQLATAASVDGAQAAKIQSAALAQFGLGAGKAGHVADLLAGAANAAQGEITDMATALTYVGPIASKAGISIDDTSTAIAELAKNGILGQKAGTGLRGLIVGLQKTTKEGAQALKLMGIDAYDAAGRFVGLRDIIDQLRTAQGKFTQQGFAKGLATVFGRQNLAAVNALVGEGTAGFDKFRKTLERSNNVERQAEARSKGLGGALRGMQSQFETLAIDLYQKVAPGLERIVRGASADLPGFIDRVKASFQRIRPDLVDFGNNFISFAQAIGEALRSMRPLAEAVGGVIVGTFRTLSDVLGKLGESKDTVKTLTKAVVIGAAAWKGYAYWAKASAIWSARFGGGKVAGGGGAGAAAKNGGIFGAVAALTGKLVTMARVAKGTAGAWLGLGRAASLSGAAIIGASQDTASASQLESDAIRMAVEGYIARTKQLRTATGAERANALMIRQVFENYLIANHVTTVNGRILESLAGTLHGLPALYAAAANGARDFMAAIGGGGVSNQSSTGALSPFRDPGHPGYVAPTTPEAKHRQKQVVDQAGTQALHLGTETGKAVADGVAKGLSSAATRAIDAAKSMVERINQQFQQLKDKARELARSIRDTMTGAADLSNLSQTDSLGAAMAPTVSSIKGFLDTQLKNDRQFRRLLKQERSRGLSESLYRQLAQAGPAALPIVQALAGASRADLRDISRTNRQIGRLGGGLGRSVSGDIYGQAIREQRTLQREANGLLRQLVRSVKDDDHFTAADARRVGKQFRHAIHDAKFVVRVDDMDKAQGHRVVTD